MNYIFHVDMKRWIVLYTFPRKREVVYYKMIGGKLNEQDIITDGISKQNQI